MRRVLLLLVLAWLASLPSTPAAAADDANAAGARATIERFEGVLLEIMKRAAALGYQGRYEIVAPAIRDVFDVPFMGRMSIGSHWEKLDEQQRRRWIETFEAFTISGFADRFDGFSGERFEILGEKPASQQTVVVQTRLVRPEADDVSLDYRMRAEKDGWRVVDIYAGGKVSEVALRRSEFGAVLRTGGIDKLIDTVAAKTSERAQAR